MKLISWGYTRKYHIKALFDAFPSSPVIFRKIKDYYFVYSVKWNSLDQPVTRSDLEKMELLLNEEFGTAERYLMRKAFSKRSFMNREAGNWLE